MNHVDFPEANKTQRAPEGMENCTSLRVYTDGERCVSVWVPTEEERSLLVSGGAIALHVVSGATQPPVALAVVPFDDGEGSLPS